MTAPITRDARRAIAMARELAAADDQGPDALAALLGRPRADLYPYALGVAMVRLRSLLAAIDDLAAQDT